ncbi:MAG: hypothetical protein WBA67_08690, partial [Jannaschia sp.]
GQTVQTPEDDLNGPHDPEITDGSSPLSEMEQGVAVADPAPVAPSEPAAARDDDGGAPAQDDADQARAAPVLLDQVAGANLSDVLGGNRGPVIQHKSDAIFGNSFADRITGGEAQDLILGNDGDDLLDGGAGRDGLYGDLGDDSLSGGDDDDILDGGWGADLLAGGDGDDLLMGGDGDDTLDGGAGSDRLFGMLGQDVMLGHLGDDLLDGTQYETGTTQDLDDGDSLDGGDGDDTLAGGSGDTLTGGRGSDVYLFRAPSAGAFGTDHSAQGHLSPWITDFDRSEDALEIVYDGSRETLTGMPPTLEVVAGKISTDLVFDGTVVARLVAGTPVFADDIRLVRMS